MALTKEKRNLFFGVGGLLAVMAMFQFLSYGVLLPYQESPTKHKGKRILILPSTLQNRQNHSASDLPLPIGITGIAVQTHFDVPAPCKNALCTFMDVTIKSKYAGRIVYLLYDKKRPLSAENFRALCTGEKGQSSKGTTLHYKETTFSRVVHNILIQGGDIHKGKALEEERESIFGASFPQESHVDELHERGLLAMAGRERSGSEFFITLDSVAELDGQYTVFGEVVKGMEVVDKINSVVLNVDGEPTEPIIISGSGQL